MSITLSLGEAVLAGSVVALVGVGMSTVVQGIVAAARSLRGTDEDPVAEALEGLTERVQELAALVRAEPVLPPAVDPWAASYERLWDGLAEPQEPALPEHPWLRDLTGSLGIELAAPVEAAPEPEVVDDEPKPRARDRFEGEPKAPKEITVAVVIPAADVRPETVEAAA